MDHLEQGTLAAINDISDRYPYAAGFLIYCIIERQVKNYLIQNDHQEKEVVRLPLGKAIGRLDSKGQRRLNGIAERRNRLMHSHMEVGSRFEPDPDKRVAANRERLKGAKQDLRRAYEEVGVGWVIRDYDNTLRFERSGA